MRHAAVHIVARSAQITPDTLKLLHADNFRHDMFYLSDMYRTYGWFTFHAYEIDKKLKRMYVSTSFIGFSPVAPFTRYIYINLNRVI
jgi:hypothetical protein